MAPPTAPTSIASALSVPEITVEFASFHWSTRDTLASSGRSARAGFAKLPEPISASMVNARSVVLGPLNLPAN